LLGLSQLPGAEGVAGAGLQVPLKCGGPSVVLEADDDNRLPGLVLLRVRGTAGVVLFEAGLEIGRDAYVTLARLGEAFE
jgi:hypothetical protein